MRYGAGNRRCVAAHRWSMFSYTNIRAMVRVWSSSQYDAADAVSACERLGAHLAIRPDAIHHCRVHFVIVQITSTGVHILFYISECDGSGIVYTAHQYDGSGIVYFL